MPQRGQLGRHVPNSVGVISACCMLLLRLLAGALQRVSVNRVPWLLPVMPDSRPCRGESLSRIAHAESRPPAKTGAGTRPNALHRYAYRENFEQGGFASSFVDVAFAIADNSEASPAQRW